MSFSAEEKKRILLYVASNGGVMMINNDEKWKKLGEEMNRDWIEIRDAYVQWKIEECQPDVDTDAMTIREIDESEYDQLIPLIDTTEGTTQEVLPVNSVNSMAGVVEYKDELQVINCTVYDVTEIEEQIINNPEALNDVSNNDRIYLIRGNKRPLDVMEDLNKKFLEILEKESTEELNLKREEHTKRMEILEMRLQQGRELHKERMKLAKIKIEKIKEAVHHIDHVLCNRNLKRKFKSGPI